MSEAAKSAAVINDSAFLGVSDNIFIYGNIRVPILHTVMNAFLALQDIIQTGHRIHIMGFYIVGKLGFRLGKAATAAVKAV